MKKNRRIYLYLALILIIGFTIYTIFKFIDIGVKKDKVKEKDNSVVEKKEKKVQKEKNNLVSYNGKLKIINNSLVNQYDEKIQLKGMSTHGIQWFGNLANEKNIKTLRDDWNSNLFRIAMYTEEGGYIYDNSLKNKVEEIADITIKLDMYVIIDWHILSDGDPLIHKEEAKKFFDEISKKYKDVPNVIYEICNEPNGDNVTWDNNIKPYAEEIIPIIRKNNKDAIIIVGTGTWSQDVDKAAENPIDDDNVMYSLHFYSGTHTSWLRDRAKKALEKIPLFVSEFGVSDASGNGGIYLEEGQLWMDFINQNNLSYANWSLSSKNETASILVPNSKEDDISDEFLTESGKFIKQIMTK